MVYLLLKKYISKSQSRQYKNWSIWYTSISLIILLQFLIFNILKINFNTINNYWFLFSTFLVTFIWIFIKNILEKNNSYEKEIYSLNQFKRNFNFFQFHCKNIEEYDDFDLLNGVTFGNNHAVIQFSLFLNLDCECIKKDFYEAYNLYLTYSDKIQLNVLFNTQPKNSKSNIVATILALNEQNSNRAKNALVDWLINDMSIENWLRKWTLETPQINNNTEQYKQYYWCIKNEFFNKSVKIINGNIFPEEYQISDLKYFIKDFQEECEWENTLKVV